MKSLDVEKLALLDVAAVPGEEVFVVDLCQRDCCQTVPCLRPSWGWSFVSTLRRCTSNLEARLPKDKMLQ